MMWLTPDGDYLVEGAGFSLLKWEVGLRGADGIPIRPARFYLITPGGTVRQAFSEPLESCVDDEASLSNIHAVSGDALMSYHVIDHLWMDLRINIRIEVAGLIPVEAEKAPSFDPRVAIQEYEQQEWVERERRYAASADDAASPGDG